MTNQSIHDLLQSQTGLNDDVGDFQRWGKLMHVNQNKLKLTVRIGRKGSTEKEV